MALAWTVRLSTVLTSFVALADCKTPTAYARGPEMVTLEGFDKPLPSKVVALPPGVGGPSITAFGKDLMGELVRKSDGSENVIMSPITIHMLMGMLYEGAKPKSDTFKQLEQALHLEDGVSWTDKSSGKERIGTGLADYGHILDHYGEISANKSVGSTVRLASTVVTSDGFTYRKIFKNSLEHNFHTSPQKFSRPSEAVNLVNDWAKKSTNGLIKSILSDGDVDSDTRMILGSACYFKSDWMDKFDKKDTGPMDFNLADGEQVKLEKGMTKVKAKFRHAHMEGYQVLELPYKNRDFNMYIGLPEENTLEAINKLASEFDLAAFGDFMTRTVISKLQMPSFAVDSEIDLEKPLRALGIEGMFDRADFRMIKEAIRVSKIKTATMVKVDEEGSEAAAVAVATFARRMAGPRPIEFIVDRPFVFMIHDKVHKAPLFIGQIVNPKQ